MTLDEKLRAIAAKGELVHLSLAFVHGDVFECTLTAASPAAGHSTGRSADPVEAVELAIKSAPIPKIRAGGGTAKTKRADTTAGEDVPRVKKEAKKETKEERTGSLPSDWTKP